ncbi:magnesium transporter, partial [Candidatus Aerophobetes bacterium]|nr:magnesium transporter [Candidatus Aerophobetes bacterium]
IFKRLGFDPALISGPLITTIVDITCLVVYFEIAIHLLGIV